MPTVYESGTNYEGYSVSSNSVLLNTIKERLENAGWFTVTDDISGTGLLLMRGVTTNNHSCWFKFTSGTGLINVTGDLDGTDTQLSPDFALTVDDGVDNRIWLSVDSSGGVLAIKSASGTWSNVYFGFYDRYDPTDVFAWGIGRLSTDYLGKYIAKAAYNAVVWNEIGTDFYYADSWGSQHNSAPYQGVFDRYGVSVNPGSFYNKNAYNPAYKAQEGSPNGLDGKAVLDTFYLLEGRGSTNNYLTPPPRLYYRGSVRFAVIGMSWMEAGAVVKDPNGIVYLTPGGLGTQGFRISA